MGLHNEQWKHVSQGALGKEITKEERDRILDTEWRANLPCNRCVIADVCKHVNGFPRPNYDMEVFNINSITCKLFDRYNIVNVAATGLDIDMSNAPAEYRTGD